MAGRIEQAARNLEDARTLRAAGLSYRALRRRLGLTVAQTGLIRSALRREKAARTRLRKAKPGATERELPIGQSALQHGGFRAGAPSEAPSLASANPAGDSLNGLAKSYADVPKLGPPMPGDIGKAMIDQQQRTLMATPSPDPLGRFAGYRLIAGSPLTGERFAQTSIKVQRALIAEVAAFLSTLHRLDQRSIAPVSKWPRAWGAVEYADRLAVERLPLIRTRLPQLAAPVAGFLQQYRIDRPPGLVVIHGDLVTDHILMEDDVERLAGIIDFGDVALGDPALDIAGCWTYGSDAVVHLIASYGLGDPGLLDRSRNHFIRYRIDRLFDALVEGKPADAVKPEVAELTMLLARYAGRS